jgi:hypothetical protein
MTDTTRRILIRIKLRDGGLPPDSLPRVWGGAGTGETCDACEEIITKDQMGIEGGGVTFHGWCFHLWDAERRAAEDKQAGAPE